jgi:hypothetical protein
MLSVKWVCVAKVRANGVDGALRSLAKNFQNIGNPIATNVAVHSATITVKPPNTTAITLVSSGIIGEY